MDIKPRYPKRWKWWCKLRNHWRQSSWFNNTREHSVIEMFDEKFNISHSFCEFCASEIKYDFGVDA